MENAVVLSTEPQADLLAFHHAAKEGDIQSVQAWLRRLENVNASLGDGWTALHYAIQYGQMVVFQVLVQCSIVDLNAKTICGTTPLSMALRRQNDIMADMLLNAGASKAAIPFSEIYQLQQRRHGLPGTLRYKLSSYWSPMWKPDMHRRFPLQQRQVCYVLLCANARNRKRQCGILQVITYAFFRRPPARQCTWRYLPPPILQSIFEFYFWLD
ncbi:hypothetical protein LEN26_011198 [Aphanomyces euteiches]|nr:hypothetical protein LEN26_011198 [Aphanomyces euteiches]